MREQQTIFDDLAELCRSPGYAHALAHLCFRDNYITYLKEITTKDVSKRFSRNALIRTEVSTLVGLLLRGALNLRLPSPPTFEAYIQRTEALLEELHQSMSAAMHADLLAAVSGNKATNPFTTGEVLREPMFYSGDSAYVFQYLEFSTAKYQSDDAWLRANRGFSISEAKAVIEAIGKIQNRKVQATLHALRALAPDQWTLLPGFTVTESEISEAANEQSATVRNVLMAFSSAPPANESFRTVHDFNLANSSPLIRLDDATYLLFEFYTLVESLYESPFYWMCGDKNYVASAMEHRGQFAERFVHARLGRVFGNGNVRSNIDVYQSKGKKLGEMDGLVVFGDRAIVIQAKSKRLTLEARKGNDLRLKDDFKKSIQNSYEQGIECVEALLRGGSRIIDRSGSDVAIPKNLKQVFIVCVISDHYPALSFQVRQFLASKVTDKIPAPLVVDVFALDAMAEMLDHPLHFLSYLDRRTTYADKVLASHELTLLSYHLRHNLWFETETDFVILQDDLSADLDIAMSARRENAPGKRTPSGILTRYRGTAFEKIIQQIDRCCDPVSIDVGIFLLTLGEDTVKLINDGIDRTVRQWTRDGRHHDFTIAVGDGHVGLTIHCNPDAELESRISLRQHCERRKYRQHADRWFGVCINPKDLSLRFALRVEFPWDLDPKLERETKGMPTQKALSSNTVVHVMKPGRNDLCSCGSGLKFKKCCGR